MVISFFVHYRNNEPFFYWTDGIENRQPVWHSSKVYCTKGGSEYFIAKGKRVHVRAAEFYPGNYTSGCHIKELD